MKGKKTQNKEEKNFLLYIPQIEHDNYKINDNNIVTLYFEHNKPIEKFARWLVKKNNLSDIVFDDKSSLAWALIVMYIRYIAKKRWIKFIGIKHNQG